MKLSQNLKSSIRALAEKYNLTLVLLFGSQAGGVIHKESDVDIAFVPERTLSVNDEVRINYELTAVFGRNDIDTVNMRTAQPLLLQQIMDGATVLYEKTGLEFSRYEAYAQRRFREAQPLFEIHRHELDRYLQSSS